MSDKTGTDDRVVKTYVWHKEKCFFVSTIERESSAAYSLSRYNETMVWEYNWDKRERGNILFQDGGPRGQIHFHNIIVQRLFDTGNPESQDEPLHA